MTDPSVERPVAQLAEYRSPKPGVGGSMPSWPAMTDWRGSVRGERGPVRATGTLGGVLA